MGDMVADMVRDIRYMRRSISGFFNFIKKARTLRVAVFVPKNSEHCFYIRRLH
jgi:hypothetical protein